MLPRRHQLPAQVHAAVPVQRPGEARLGELGGEDLNVVLGQPAGQFGGFRTEVKEFPPWPNDRDAACGTIAGRSGEQPPERIPRIAA